MEIKKLYRIEDPMFCDLPISIKEYKVLRETEKTYFIHYHSKYFSNEKRVTKNKNARNPFAFCTKEKAINNYYHRKKKQVEILTMRLNEARIFLLEAEKLLNYN